ncbi:hypothetical protein BASA61_002710 [Batrachochytrium salamandrivorans]|nr:hypothetical protein BASA61_002710 [Batrachochytrium salamandrivorans]
MVSQRIFDIFYGSWTNHQSLINGGSAEVINDSNFHRGCQDILHRLRMLQDTTDHFIKVSSATASNECAQGFSGMVGPHLSKQSENTVKCS